MRARGRLAAHAGERGVGLMEIIVATFIAVIAVVGLAYTIGTGRGLVSRYELARMGLAEAQRKMEELSALRPGDPQLAIPAGRTWATYSEPFLIRGVPGGSTSWTVEWATDPADSFPGGHSLRHVTVRTSWGAGMRDSVSLDRMFPAY